MIQLCEISSENLNTFFGLCLNSQMPISVWRYATKGSLEDVLHNDNVKLDWFFKYSLIKDLVAGMEYLHESPLECHGRLKSSNCLIDGRWALKITDYGLINLRTPLKDAKSETINIYAMQLHTDKLWSAPEMLRMQTMPLKGTPLGDVFSFAIVVQEILTRDRPYCNDDLSAGGKQCLFGFMRCRCDTSCSQGRIAAISTKWPIRSGR